MFLSAGREVMGPGGQIARAKSVEDTDGDELLCTQPSTDTHTVQAPFVIEILIAAPRLSCAHDVSAIRMFMLCQHSIIAGGN